MRTMLAAVLAVASVTIHAQAPIYQRGETCGYRIPPLRLWLGRRHRRRSVPNRQLRRLRQRYRRGRALRCICRPHQAVGPPHCSSWARGCSRGRANESINQPIRRLSSGRTSRRAGKPIVLVRIVDCRGGARVWAHDVCTIAGRILSGPDIGFRVETNTDPRTGNPDRDMDDSCRRRVSGNSLYIHSPEGSEVTTGSR
jgi:hypothetical protein